MHPGRKAHKREAVFYRIKEKAGGNGRVIFVLSNIVYYAQFTDFLL